MTNAEKIGCVVLLLYVPFFWCASFNGSYKSPAEPTVHVIKIVIEVKADDPSGSIGEALPAFPLPLERQDIL